MPGSSSGSKASRRRNISGSAARTAGCRPAKSSISIRAQVFVHRNVANLAPPQDANYLSVLQFAVDVLKVKHILVVGHYGCGGIKAAVDGQRRGLVDHWLHPIREVYQENRAELDAIPNQQSPARPAMRAERHPPAPQRGVRRLRAGCLGARADAQRPWLGLFHRQRADNRLERDRQRARGTGPALLTTPRRSPFPRRPPPPKRPCHETPRHPRVAPVHHSPAR